MISLLILFTLGGVAAREPAPAPVEGGSTGGARVLPTIAVFIGIYVLHVAIETGVGGWEPPTWRPSATAPPPRRPRPPPTGPP